MEVGELLAALECAQLVFGVAPALLYEAHLVIITIIQKQALSLYLLVVVVLLQLQGVHCDVVALGLTELLALSEFFGFVFDDLFFDLNREWLTSP